MKFENLEDKCLDRDRCSWVRHGPASIMAPSPPTFRRFIIYNGLYMFIDVYTNSSPKMS